MCAGWGVTFYQVGVAALQCVTYYTRARSSRTTLTSRGEPRTSQTWLVYHPRGSIGLLASHTLKGRSLSRRKYRNCRRCWRYLLFYETSGLVGGEQSDQPRAPTPNGGGRVLRVPPRGKYRISRRFLWQLPGAVFQSVSVCMTASMIPAGTVHFDICTTAMVARYGCGQE